MDDFSLPKRPTLDADPSGAPARPRGTPAPYGQEIRDLRRARRLTLPRMAALTGYSTGFLSQVERGLSSPSVEALHRIAEALGVTISWFFRNEQGDEAERDVVVRARNRRSLPYGAGITDELLSPHLRGQLELLHCRFPPGASSGPEPYAHRGEEAGFVLRGRLELQVGDRTFVLEAGDSFAYPSTTPHRYANPGDEETVVVWAVTPPSY